MKTFFRLKRVDDLVVYQKGNHNIWVIIILIQNVQRTSAAVIIA